ncbi:FHF complex subunit HOOK-interacting protein 2B [Hoplias malabaricus]|uniref:FHF complex subunit HOOK-interacting protein 2B n=1 Tax=Hoplias malabaricus TaxID=27720 RepID=UPI00346244E2
MDVLNKLTTLFQQALETREPSINLLDSFVDHWKGITNYYIETTDESRPVKQTDIPWRLKQMLDILVYEEKQQDVEETGACMEYLLQHKILETLCTLGKAQYPPGMRQQVLLFFSKVLSQIQKPILHIINVYRPVQKLIRLCALPSSQTEKEEVHFLFAVCSRVKKDPYVLNYILETTKEEQLQRSSSVSEDSLDEGSSGASSPGSPSSSLTPTHNSSQPGIIQVLMQLGKSQKCRVALRAMECVLLLVSVPQEETAKLLAEETPLCDLLAQRLCELYGNIPTTLHPTDLHSYPLKEWRTPEPTAECVEESPPFPAQEHVDRFFCWLDYCDQLIAEAPKILGAKLSKALHQQWLTAVIQPHLLQMSEVGILVHTALLSCAVRYVSSPALLQELLLFLLGSDTHHEQRKDTPPHTHTLRYHLIEHCDHISDEISITTLRMFEELLKKPDRNILNNLVLRNLESRSYRLHGSGEERPAAESDLLEESEDLEEDPFFPDSEFSGSESLLSLSREERRSSSRTQIAETVNSFLCLVPQEAKTTQHVQGAGYDTYVHDALKSLKECSAASVEWGWPDTPKPIDASSSSTDFYEGHFLKVLFNRLTRILEQPYELNLQVTSVLSRLALFPHPHLHEYLLDPYISLSPGARSLFSTLVRVIGELMQRIQHIPNFTQRLILVRRQLMGLEEDALMDHATLLKGVIVLEEFCKELAAIAFVKLPLGDQELLSAYSP